MSTCMVGRLCRDFKMFGLNFVYNEGYSGPIRTRMGCVQ